MRKIYLFYLPVLLIVYACDNPENYNDTFHPFLDSLDQSIEEFVNGRPDAFMGKWYQGDDITLAGGLGGEIALGWDMISERLHRVSGMYGEHSRSSFDTERVAAHQSGSSGYLVQHEHIRIENDETGELITRKYRTTMIFKYTPEGWHVVHRQADLHTLEEERLDG